MIRDEAVAALEEVRRYCRSLRDRFNDDGFFDWADEAIDAERGCKDALASLNELPIHDEVVSDGR